MEYENAKSVARDLARLGNDVRDTQDAVGRVVQDVLQLSMDTWVTRNGVAGMAQDVSRLSMDTQIARDGVAGVAQDISRLSMDTRIARKDIQSMKRNQAYNCNSKLSKAQMKMVTEVVRGHMAAEKFMNINEEVNWSITETYTNNAVSADNSTSTPTFLVPLAEGFQDVASSPDTYQSTQGSYRTAIGSSTSHGYGRRQYRSSGWEH